jgi:hypothetical protein
MNERVIESGGNGVNDGEWLELQGRARRMISGAEPGAVLGRGPEGVTFEMAR